MWELFNACLFPLMMGVGDGATHAIALIAGSFLASKRCLLPALCTEHECMDGGLVYWYPTACRCSREGWLGWVGMGWDGVSGCSYTHPPAPGRERGHDWTLVKWEPVPAKPNHTRTRCLSWSKCPCTTPTTCGTKGHLISSQTIAAAGSQFHWCTYTPDKGAKALTTDERTTPQDRQGGSVQVQVQVQSAGKSERDILLRHSVQEQEDPATFGVMCAAIICAERVLLCVPCFCTLFFFVATSGTRLSSLGPFLLLSSAPHSSHRSSYFTRCTCPDDHSSFFSRSHTHSHTLIFALSHLHSCTLTLALLHSCTSLAFTHPPSLIPIPHTPYTIPHHTILAHPPTLLFDTTPWLPTVIWTHSSPRRHTRSSPCCTINNSILASRASLIALCLRRLTLPQLAPQLMMLQLTR